MKISIKSLNDIEKMKVAGKLAAEVLDMITPYIVPGISTGELDKLCHEHIVNIQNAIPANIGYKGYEKEGHVLFHVPLYLNYGKLSNIHFQL